MENAEQTRSLNPPYLVDPDDGQPWYEWDFWFGPDPWIGKRLGIMTQNEVRYRLTLGFSYKPFEAVCLWIVSLTPEEWEQVRLLALVGHAGVKEI